MVMDVASILLDFNPKLGCHDIQKVLQRFKYNHPTKPIMLICMDGLTILIPLFLGRLIPERLISNQKAKKLCLDAKAAHLFRKALMGGSPYSHPAAQIGFRPPSQYVLVLEQSNLLLGK